MRLDAIEVRLVKIPLRRSFRTSFGQLPEKTAVVIELRTSDGLSGFGEASALASPTYTEESVYSVFQVSVRELAPRLLGRDVSTAEQLLGLLAPVRGNRFAKTGFETAFWDLLSQWRREPLWVSLGGVRPSIEVGDSLSILDSVGDLLQLVATRLDEGYRRIKLKIAPGWDTEPVRAVRQHHPDIVLSVDANAAYDLSDLRVFRQLDDLGLLMIEQPLDFADLVNHARLQSLISTPICLDESIPSVGSARLALDLHSCETLNIKTGRVGGLVEARRIHDLCAVHEVPVWMGGMFETGIGRAFNIALASLENFSLPADMSPPSMYFESDLVEEGFELDHGLVKVPTSEGIGFIVSVERLGRYTVEHATLRGREAADDAEPSELGVEHELATGT